MLLAVLIASALGTPATASLPDPLAMAGEGRLQCYRPDVQKKTCQSIASYLKTGPGTYDNKALIPVAAHATLETHTPVVIRGDAVCGYMRGEDVLAGTLRLDGEVLAPEKAKPFLERIAQGVAPMSGKEICTRYESSGAGLSAKVSIGGTYQPDGDQVVTWVSPADGYTVQP
jgi:hypothetical protein